MYELQRGNYQGAGENCIMASSKSGVFKLTKLSRTGNTQQQTKIHKEFKLEKAHFGVAGI